MNGVSIFVALLFALVLVACSAEPEIVEVTVEVPVEVTRVVSEITEVEVTRVVNEVEEVQVTRLIEVETEVTRLVEKVVTATPLPTEETTPTPEPTVTTSESQPSSISMLQSMKSVRSDLESFGGFIDAAVGGQPLPCLTAIELYDRIGNARSYNIPAGNPELEFSINGYQSAISLFTSKTKDLAQNCRDFVASTETSGTIPFQQWGMARQAVNDALDLIIPAISNLES